MDTKQVPCSMPSNIENGWLGMKDVFCDKYNVMKTMVIMLTMMRTRVKN